MNAYTMRGLTLVVALLLVGAPLRAQNTHAINCVLEKDGQEERRADCEEAALREVIRRIWNQRHPDNPFPEDSIVESVRKDTQTARASQQVNVSSLASALSTLVDKPGGTDFLALALNSGAFAREEKDNVVTFSTSLYAVSSIFAPGLASDFEQFQKHRRLRRLTIAISAGKADEPTATGTNSLNLTSVIAKYQFGTRDARDPEFDAEYGEVQKLLGERANALSALFAQDPFKELVRTLAQKQMRSIDLAALLAEVESSPEIMKAIENFGSNPAAIGVRRVNVLFKEIAEKAKRRWLGSIGFGGRFMEGMEDEFTAEGILSGYAGAASVTVNGSITWFDDPMGTGRNLDIKVGVELLREFENLSITRENLGSSFSLGFNYEDGDRPRKIRGQVKWEFFLSKGISFPLSVTWANRTEFVNETEVRGNFGISYDFTHLLKALQK